MDSFGRLSGGAMQPLEEVRQGESRMYNVGNFTMADTGCCREHIARWEFYNGRAGGVEPAECLPLVNLWSKPPQPWLCQSGYILGQTPKKK